MHIIKFRFHQKFTSFEPRGNCYCLFFGECLRNNLSQLPSIVLIHNQEGRRVFVFLAFPSTPRLADQNFDTSSRPLEKSASTNEFGFDLMDIVGI